MITSATHINQIKVSNYSDADIIDWYVEVPYMDGVQIGDQSFDSEVCTEERDGQTYQFFKLTKKIARK